MWLRKLGYWVGEWLMQQTEDQGVPCSNPAESDQGGFVPFQQDMSLPLLGTVRLQLSPNGGTEHELDHDAIQMMIPRAMYH